MRVQDGSTGANQVHYLFADHLGSTNVTYNTANSSSTAQRYYPWGTVRPGPGNTLPTGYTFTGQLDSGLGLMYYGARFYDGALGRFIQPDTIVPEPGDPQALNRYSYVLNNPLRYTDPTGMFSENAVYSYILNGECGGSSECAYNMYAQWQSNAEWWQMLMTAQAGDVLFGSFNIGGHPAEEFAFSFGGSGADVLAGIYSSDLAGNQVAGVLNQARLSDVFAGSASLVSFYAPYEFAWGGLVAFSSGQIVFRESMVSGMEYLPSYSFSLGGVMDDLGQRAQRAAQSKSIAMVACYGVSSPLCSIAVSVAHGTVASGSPMSRPGSYDHEFSAAGVTWIVAGTYQQGNRPGTVDWRHIGRGVVFGNRQVDFVLRVRFE